MLIDHINSNGLDNRRSNLRVCSQAQNLQNRPAQVGRKHGRYKGTGFRPGLKKPWSAKLNTKGKNMHLGYFATEIEAAKAYNKAALEHFKDYAYLNIIEEES